MIWAWHTWENSNPWLCKWEKCGYTHREAKSKYNVQKVSLLFWRVEYLVDYTVGYQETWAMRNLICYWGLLLYKLGLRISVWIRVREWKSVIDSSLSYVYHLVQEQGLETVLLSYKAICISTAFLFILCSLTAVTFYILKCVLGENKKY